ncbi:uncharacterized protein LOC117892362 [Drosophila subobscura]|uniref:uncharacterized protein LOC117892362 n=1 Tax=Drosophila subobscura TaxID=7241 RepID=UPI00155AE6A4|nr:uncharacterized protein LOC117892362 [Drosophila subobscura]
MPSCKRHEIRRTCRPQPSLLARFNCTQCNRLMFFMVGVGAGVLYIRNKFNETPEPDKKKK